MQKPPVKEAGRGPLFLLSGYPGNSATLTGMDELQIRSGLEKLSLHFPDKLSSQLHRYLQMLVKWNKAFNLTAIRSQDDMLTHHILDSLVVAPYLEGPRVLDVGTGPGFPGLPLAMLMPDLQYFLLDSNSKKTRFVSQVVFELELKNVEVINSRVEDYQPVQTVNTVVSRAFSNLGEFVQKTSRFCQKKGLLIAMKGRYPTDELKAIDPDLDIEVKKLQIPGLNEERHLVLVRVKGEETVNG